MLLVTCSFLQVLLSLLGSRITSLIEATPTSDDITEGSASLPTLVPPSLGLALNHHRNTSRLASRQEAVPRFFLDFLRRQVKTRRRSHKSMVGGRGCFGMKLDRIGSISGLGC
ncbi:hypothetical protein ATANTOWER_005246 [Ataeniobius toweri]|uniref:Uncharacterized protein n=1 Tax=Ataeniobius toweri TaxID=208326 RepID=A0ABU7A560_9TELE|nr:hypothetical protein [Ataeniobius toweri]